MKRWRWIPFVLLPFAGCLLPDYTLVDGPFGSAGSGGEAGEGAVIDSGAGTDSGASGCGAGQKNCAGQCVALDDVEYGCGNTTCSQAECPAGSSALACEDGACVIGSCPEGLKKCDGRCVSITDPTYGCSAEGCSDDACPEPGTGTLVCSGSTCEVGECGPDTKQCGTRCVPRDAANGCADAARCTPCEANEVCPETAGFCTCVPDDEEACKGKACGPAINNCGAEVRCFNSCKLPQKCGEGEAGPNECGCMPFSADRCQYAECGSIPDGCGGKLDCPDTCPASTPFCSLNRCVICIEDDDCSSLTCAPGACREQLSCDYDFPEPNTPCPDGGTCSTTGVGACLRPPVTVDGGFDIDATEVTIGRYREFVFAKAGDMSGQPEGCSSNSTYGPAMGAEVEEYEEPATGVNWCGAYMFCKWAGRRLCGTIGGGAGTNNSTLSTATGQWSRACGSAANLTYPYGNSFVADRCATGDRVPVGSSPQCVGAAAGLHDMSGSAAEWVDDCDAADRCRVRGASVMPMVDAPNEADALRCASSIAVYRTDKLPNVGFRCCSNP